MVTVNHVLKPVPNHRDTSRYKNITRFDSVASCAVAAIASQSPVAAKASVVAVIAVPLPHLRHSQVAVEVDSRKMAEPIHR